MFSKARIIISSRRTVLIGCLLMIASGIGFTVLNRTAKAAPPTTWNVSVGSMGTCTTLDPNCSTIGGAVAAATAGDTINVAAGTYNESNINIDKSLTINGAGAKTTIVDAGRNGRVFDVCCGTINISGLTIKNGFTGASMRVSTSKNWIAANAVGIAADGVSPDGGGIYNNPGSTLTLTDCVISDNATGGGGTIIFQNAQKSNQRFAHVVKGGSTSQAPTGQPGGKGGGIYNGGTLSLFNCTVSNNRTGNGGDSDTVGGTGGDGGGIFSLGTLSITNSTIANNQTGRGGNLISFVNTSNAKSSGINTVVSAPGNGGEGGGIANSGSLDIRNSTIAGNQTGPAGGFGSPATGAKQASGNVAPSDAATGYGGNGGGLYTGATMSGVIVQSTIIATNTVAAGGIGPDVFSDIAVNSQGYNLIGIKDGSSGFGPPTPPTDQSGTMTTPLNPMLGALADNGGQTPTMALLSNSPAIDKGINSGCAGQAGKTTKGPLRACGLSFDQRGAGYPRTVDNLSVANAADGTDVGAFELPAPGGPCAPDTTPPVISCPAGITKTADAGQSSATVSPGSPAASDNCALQSVVGVRSDGQPLNAPYPIGVTTITWTARDASGNTASCSQSIGVTVAGGSRRNRIIP